MKAMGSTHKLHLRLVLYRTQARQYAKLFHGLPVEQLCILACLSAVEESGTLGGAVKCVDIKRNTEGEGSSLGRN